LPDNAQLNPIRVSSVAPFRESVAPHIRPNMNPFTEPITVSHYLAIGAVLFVAGAVCMATKRNALGVLMGIELVLNGANVNFVAFGSRFFRRETLGLDGELIALFVIVLAAAEAAVALAIALNFYNNHTTIDVDQANDLKG
jgi:NADH:ubiquinone oxidoreductase subunit K